MNVNSCAYLKNIATYLKDNFCDVSISYWLSNVSELKIVVQVIGW